MNRRCVEPQLLFGLLKNPVDTDRVEEVVICVDNPRFRTFFILMSIEFMRVILTVYP